MRVRDIGLKIGFFEPGATNSIVDVKGVSVGHCTLISGEGKLIPGKGPVRTGVTVIFPHEDKNVFKNKVFASSYVINGFGKPIGLVQLNELGQLETPIALTNTLNVGLVADAIIEYMLDLNTDIGVTTGTVNPVVLECNDGFLNDIRGRHVKHEHVYEAIKNVSCDRVLEGAVGAGTGMSCFEFKGGIGSASRKLPKEVGGYTIGVLVLSNFGRRIDLTIAGIPVGLELKDYGVSKLQLHGSIVIIIATDAPLTPRQLNRLAKRATHGLARTGSYSSHGSGDFVVAFSNAHKIPHYGDFIVYELKMFNENYLSYLFRAVVEAVEEAILNSMFMAETTIGRDGNIRYAIPIDKVVDILVKYNVLKS
ncbi:MAG: P1 family peptidase [Candidatus Methanomethylicia archaeon]|nr:P1 family peptidase [Candidatus Methanomethylicia archaeon]